jgi:hypothetical protein
MYDPWEPPYDEYEDYIERMIDKEMENHRQEAKDLVKNIIRQDMVDDFLKLLAFGVFWEEGFAYNIAEMVGFQEEHCLAVLDKVNEYRKLYEKNNPYDEDFDDSQLYEECI